jgi:hypothetical protein
VVGVFAITSARAYREKVEEDLAALMMDIASSGRAINAVTSTYHLHEWLWADVLKSSSPYTLGTVIITKKTDFVAWLDSNCPHFGLVQALTSGSKHAFPVHSGGKIEGFGMGPFGVGPWDAPYLLIDLGEDAPERYLMASEVIKDAGSFMVNFSKQLGA